MSEAKHTPGPWIAGNAGEDNDVPIFSDAPRYADIRLGWVSNRLGDRKETVANAALIAAAPDLLAACHWLLDAIDIHAPNGPSLSCRLNARAAIDKAERGGR